MRINPLSILFYLLITIPISFKIEVISDVYMYPQELLLPAAILLILITKKKAVFPKFMLPFFLLLAGLLVILISTIFSLLNQLNLIGLAKCIKYVLYVISILFLSNYNFKNFLQIFNKIAFFTIAVTLLIYVYQLLTFPGSLKAFFHATTWLVEYVPSGFSNLILQLPEFSFIRSGGNHNIYGTFLVLVYVLNLDKALTRGSDAKKLNFVLILFSVLNLLLITSREALVVFFVVNFLYIFNHFLKLKVKKFYLYLLFVMILGVSIALWFNIDLGLLNKLEYTLESISETGGETNLNLRFHIWHLISLSFLLFPANFLIGVGYNEDNLLYYLNETNMRYGLYERFPSNPESLFFTFLTYGGVIAFCCILFFWILIFKEILELRKRSVIVQLYLYLTIGIFIANNTGSSLLSDLLLTQYAMTYIWIKVGHSNDKNTPLNDKNG